jgi:hypothetical protein
MKNTQTSILNEEKKRERELNKETDNTLFYSNPNSNPSQNIITNNTNRLTKEFKYNEIREKLDKLNYKLHFDISNLQLIELMTNDIFSLRTEIENLKKNSLNLKESNDRSLLNVAAFKKENIKLIKENNELIKQNIELGKNLHNSNNGKSLEIKRLQEEKADFKFMLSNSKIKIENMAKENSMLRNKLNTLLSKIYDTNFNENNLKTLFYSENNNTNNNYKVNSNDFIGDSKNKTGDLDALSTNLPFSKDISELKIGVYVKQRNLHMTSNLDNANNSLSKLNENKEYLKKVIKETFAKRKNLYLNNNYNQNENENENRIHDSNEEGKKELNII